MKIPTQTPCNQQSQVQSITQASYEVQTLKQSTKKRILTGAISNNLKYIIAGGADNILNIWSYRNFSLIKSIKFDDQVMISKFTDDSSLLYVGIGSFLYLLFYVNNQIRKLSKQELHNNDIDNIYFMTNTIILSQSYKTIIKTDFLNKQQLLKIQVYDYDIYGLDYNKSLDIIASGSNLSSIKLWNGNNGSLIIEQQNAHNYNTVIFQVLFVIHNNKLVSLESTQKIIIWSINYETKQLENLYEIENSGFNISLVLQKQNIIATGQQFISVFTIQGEFIREFSHDVNIFNLFFNIVQLDSLKAVLIDYILINQLNYSSVNSILILNLIKNDIKYEIEIIKNIYHFTKAISL